MQNVDRYVELVTNGDLVSALNPIPTSGGGGGGGGPVTIANGADVTQGAVADAAVSTDANGTISAKLRGVIVNLVALLARLPAALTGSGNFKVSLAESTVSQIVRASSLSWTDGSATITTGATAQTVFAANATRARLFVQNQSTDLLWINFGVTAVQSQPSVRLEPFDVWVDLAPSCTSQLVSIIGPTTGQAFCAKEAS